MKETRALGRGWLEGEESLALRVPSVVLDGEYNLLINPGHADIKKLKTLRSAAFSFDPRLYRG